MTAVCLLAAGCSDTDDGSTVEDATGPSASAGESAQLVSRDCDTPPSVGSAMCYWLEVPERRDIAGAKTIKLWVAVVTPDDASPDALPVVILAGGPGDSGSRPVLERRSRFLDDGHPIVFVDQRGTGLSEPRLDCPELDGAFDATQEWGVRVDGVRIAARTCRDRLEGAGIDLNGYDTVEDAADLVDLRNRLGFDRWVIYGVSYGGRLAQELIRQDPQGAAGVILDSSATTGPLGPASLVERAQDATARLAAACAAEPTCEAITPNFEASFVAAVARLDATPYVTTVDDAEGNPMPLVITGQEIVSGAFSAQYDRDLIRLLPSAAKAIAEGDNGIIDALAAQILRPTGTATGLFHVSTCADWQANETGDDQAVLRDPGRYGTLVLGWPWAACGAWGVDSVPGGRLEAVHSDVPALLFEGGLDPVAPPSFADSITEGLDHATVVVVPAGGHGNAHGTDCATSVTRAFLAEPTAPLDTSCVASLPPPFAQ